MTDLYVDPQTLVEPERYRAWLENWKTVYDATSKAINGLKRANSARANIIDTKSSNDPLFDDVRQLDRGIMQRYQTRLSAYANGLMELRYEVDAYRQEERRRQAEVDAREEMFRPAIRAVRINRELENNPRLRLLLEALIADTVNNPDVDSATRIEASREGLVQGEAAVNLFAELMGDRNLMQNLIAIRKNWQN